MKFVLTNEISNTEGTEDNLNNNLNNNTNNGNGNGKEMNISLQGNKEVIKTKNNKILKFVKV